MTIDQLINCVRSSQSSDWLDVDEQVFVFKNDLNIRITDGETVEEIFPEDWAKAFPAADPRRCDYTLWYGATPVKKYAFVVVDAGRASLPLPKINTMEITAEQSAVAHAVNRSHVDGPSAYFNRYIQRFTVVE